MIHVLYFRSLSCIFFHLRLKMSKRSFLSVQRPFISYPFSLYMKTLTWLPFAWEEPPQKDQLLHVSHILFCRKVPSKQATGFSIRHLFFSTWRPNSNCKQVSFNHIPFLSNLKTCWKISSIFFTSHLLVPLAPMPEYSILHHTLPLILNTRPWMFSKLSF